VKRPNENWEVLEVVSGDLQAELLRGLLEAQGIPVVLSKEGAARAIGIDIGPLGEVEILVTSSSKAAAQQILADYHAGVFEVPDENHTPVEDDSDLDV